MKQENNYVAIMAGGIGSRFWPMSKAACPKQFLDILNTGKTLLQSTFDRYAAFIPQENIYIITSQAYVEIVREQLPQLALEQIIGEPQRRNTAPCIAYMAMKLFKKNPKANLIVAPSDHLILEEDKFRKNCEEALSFTAENNAFVTLGIQPNHPNTGYGYIQYQRQATEQSIRPVFRFTEKPDRDTAARFLEDGSYLWNAGIFIWKAADLLKSFQVHVPSMHERFSEAWAAYNTSNESTAVAAIYNDCDTISIDYAILEKANNVYVIAADFTWSDLGTWKSAWENIPKDADQNATNHSNTLMIDARECLVYSTDQRLVLLGGVEDLIVVNTPEALMVCRKEKEQMIKEYLIQVKESTGVRYL